MALGGARSSKALAHIYGDLPVKKIDISEQLRQQLNELCDCKTGGFLGGAEGGVSELDSFVGGYADLQSYGDSVFSRAKEKLIRDIAEDVFAALKVQGSKYAQTAPIAEVIKNLAKIVPNPKKGAKFNDSFNKSSGKQRDVVHALGTAINDHYGGNLIDMSASESVMCERISEVMNSLFTGLHTEFMAVAGDVLRVVQNLNILKQWIDASYRKQRELVAASGDAQLRSTSENVELLYNKLNAEVDRQLSMLTNLTNVVIGPTSKSLISLLEDNRDFHGLVKDLKDDLGTTTFGEKISHLVSGVSSVAHSAELIDKALKRIGMTVAEFNGAKNAQDLRLKIYSRIQDKSPSSKELDSMLAAAEVIYKNDYSHRDIAAVLSKKRGAAEGGGDCGCTGGTNGDPDNVSVASGVSAVGSVEGGFEDDDEGLGEKPKVEETGYWARKSLSTKIRNKKRYRNLMFKDFSKLLREHYRRIIDATVQVTKRVGNEIPISEDMHAFIQAFSTLQCLDRENLHIALTGWAKDAASREQRESFLNTYKLVTATLEPLVRGPGGSHFKQIQTEVNSMIKSIDDFSDKMLKAVTEIHVDRPEEIRAALGKISSNFFGSADIAGAGGDESLSAGAFASFKKAQNELTYYYSIANIKASLANTSVETASFGQDYEQILGAEAGWLINQINTEHNNLDAGIMAAAEGKAPPAGTPETPESKAVLAYYNNADIAHANTGNRNQDARRIAAKAAAVNMHNLLEYQRDAKVKMVKVAQAVDLYLRAFANGISQNPDSISSVLKMLTQVEIVAKWFNERSGNNLTALFDAFPSHFDPTKASEAKYADGAGGEIKVNDAGHYYEHLATKSAAGNMPGNPFNGIPSDMAESKEKLKQLRAHTEKTVKTMRALENILSAFATVGSKFGDLNLQSKTFMSPGQIFTALCQYITASAFTTHFKPGVALATAAAHSGGATGLYHGVVESKTVNVNGTEYDVPSVNTTNYRDIVANVLANEDVKYTFDSQRIAAHTDFINNSNGLDAEGKATMITTSVAAALPATGYGLIVGVSPDASSNGHGGIGTAAAAEAKALLDFKRMTSIAMSAIPADSYGNYWQYHDHAQRGSRMDVAGWSDRFYDTDALFTMTVKSIVCKVFTVVDAYRLFNRPTTDRFLSNSMSPVRTILGGSEGGADGGAEFVKVIPEAMELYLRLPLLAEWYRETFAFKAGRSADPFLQGEWRLSILPSLDGTWSGLVNILFDKADYVNEGNYTESQIQKIIEEINGVYKAYKSKYATATIRSIISAFVIEMNRVFGFMKQTEINAYFEDRRNNLESKTYTREDTETFLDYDILNANDQFSNGIAPSDKFTTTQIKPSVNNERKLVHLQQAIDKIRRAVDVQFTQALNSEGGVDDSFVGTLRAYKKSLEAAKSDKDAYKVIVRMIQGSGNRVKINVEKVLMLHETVIAPLAVLYNVYKVLAKFNALLHGASLNNLNEFYKARVAWSDALDPGYNGVNLAGSIAAVAGGRTPAGGALQADHPDDYRGAYRSFLEFITEYKTNGVSDAQKELFASACVSDLMNASAAVAGTACFGYFKNVATIVQCAGGVGAFGDFHDHFNGALLMRDLICALLDLCTNPNKLIQCTVSDTGAINVDHAPLQELCEVLMAQVKTNVNKMRLELITSTDNKEMQETFAKLENVEFAGSVRWLDENLFKVLFENRDRSGLPSAYNHLTYTMQALIRQRPAAGPFTPETGFVYTHDQALRDIVYYQAQVGAVAAHAVTDSPLPVASRTNNLKDFPFNVIATREDLTNAQNLAVGVCKSDAGFGGMGLPPFTDANALEIPLLAYENAASLNSWYTCEPYKMKSLMMSFNRALRRYIADNVDDSTTKFYVPLIESFMNSAGSRELLRDDAFPDVYERGDNAAEKDQIMDGTSAATANAHAPNRSLHNNRVTASPPEGVLLFRSTGIAVRSLVNTFDTRLKRKKFAYDSLADVPEYMRERMRAGLPYYSKLFGIFHERAELLRRLLNNTKLSENIKSCADNALPVTVGSAWLDVVQAATAADDFGAGGLATPKKVVAMFNTFQANTAERAAYFNTLLSRLSECAVSVKKCADQVYRELQDTSPYFMEMHKDSISDFKSRTGQLPLMPASHVLLPQMSMNGMYDQFHTSDLHKLMLPSNMNGSNEFKFNYAARLLLGRSDIEPQMDHMPGAKDIYNNYAAMASKTGGLTAQEYANTIKTMVRLARFVNDGVVYCKLFALEDFRTRAACNPQSTTHYRCSSVMHAAIDLPTFKTQVVNPNAAAAAANQAAAILLRDSAEFKDVTEPGKTTLKPYQFLPNATALSISLSENSQVNSARESFVKGIMETSALAKSQSRADARIKNILDLNIVPINVHAFMREVPFANILNYSYTFDRMVHDFIVPDYVKSNRANVDSLMIKPTDNVRTTRELMVKLLVHPYADLARDTRGRGVQYYALLGSLFNGNDDMKLGRPRYLSDQLWHKVLMTASARSIMSGLHNEVVSNEAGPAAYEANRGANLDSLSVGRMRQEIKEHSDALAATNAVAQATVDIANSPYSPTHNFAAAEVKSLFVLDAESIIDNTNRSTVLYLANYSYLYNNGRAGYADVVTGLRTLSGLPIAKFLQPNNTLGAGVDNFTQQNRNKNKIAGVNQITTADTAHLVSRLFTYFTNRQAQNGTARAVLVGTNDVSIFQTAGGDWAVPDVAGEVSTNALHNAFRVKYPLSAGVAATHMAAFENATDTEAKCLAILKDVTTDATRALIAACVWGNAETKNIVRFMCLFKFVLDHCLSNNEFDQWFKQLFLEAILKSGNHNVVNRQAVNLNQANLQNHFVNTYGTGTADQLLNFKTLGGNSLINVDKSMTKFELYRRAKRRMILIWFTQMLVQCAANFNADVATVSASLREVFICYVSGSVTALIDSFLAYAGGSNYALNTEEVAAGRNVLPLVLSAGPNEQGLRFWDTTTKQWKNAGENMSPGTVVYCAEVGRARFDTKLVRNMTWLVQLQRVMRVVLTNHLSFIDTPVIRGITIADENVTEYNANDAFDNELYNGSKYSVL